MPRAPTGGRARERGHRGGADPRAAALDRQYVETYLEKTGDEWVWEDSALYYALSLDQFALPAARVLLRFPTLVLALSRFALLLVRCQSAARPLLSTASTASARAARRRATQARCCWSSTAAGAASPSPRSHSSTGGRGLPPPPAAVVSRPDARRPPPAA